MTGFTLQSSRPVELVSGLPTFLRGKLGSQKTTSTTSLELLTSVRRPAEPPVLAMGRSLRAVSFHFRPGRCACLILLSLTLFGGIAHAGEGEAAVLDADYIIKGIRFPKGDDDVHVVIRCEVVLATDRSARYLGCIDKLAHPKYHRAVLRRGNLLVKGTPAVHVEDGRRIPVRALVKFSIVFWRRSQEQSIRYLPNHGLNRERFGQDYIAPQRMSPWAGFAYDCPRDFHVVVRGVAAATHASLGDLEFEPLLGNAKCTDEIREYFEQEGYLPGSHGGKAVPMSVVEHVTAGHPMVNAARVREARRRFGF